MIDPALPGDLDDLVTARLRDPKPPTAVSAGDLTELLAGDPAAGVYLSTAPGQVEPVVSAIRFDAHQGSPSCWLLIAPGGGEPDGDPALSLVEQHLPGCPAADDLHSDAPGPCRCDLEALA